MDNTKANILVVDDDRYVSDIIKLMLEAEDFTVAVAGDGPTALQQIAENRPDLVLLDVMLPGLSGYDILERLRKTSQIPVIILTGVQEPDSVAKGLSLGADDFIKKPFLSQELLARIRTKLRRSRVQAQDYESKQNSAN